MRDRRRPFAILIWTLGSAIVVGGSALRTAETHARMPAQNAGQVNEGRELFTTYCASCHGVTGAGNGPAAAALRQRPADLTGIALANGGVFPAERLGRIIDGREVEAHGNRTMPVWGDAFKAAPGGHSDATVRARIETILKYLASLQRRQA